METVLRISDIDPQDLPLVERLFGQPVRANSATELVLRTAEPGPPNGAADTSDGIPDWCNVLEGFSEQDLAEFDALMAEPVRIGRPEG